MLTGRKRLNVGETQTERQREREREREREERERERNIYTARTRQTDTHRQMETATWLPLLLRKAGHSFQHTASPWSQAACYSKQRFHMSTSTACSQTHSRKLPDMHMLQRKVLFTYF